MSTSKAIIIIGISLLSTFTLNGQFNDEDLKNTDISILTCRSGDELYSTFGHTAIRIQNKANALDITYNYGVFSFNTPYFYLKFMRGKLPYYLAATKTEYFLQEYVYEQRTVIEQKLNLNSEQKKRIIDFLIENAKKENRYYKYEFFFDNCTTRALDLYNLAGNVTYSNTIESKTFRDLLKENLRSLVWSDFGIDLVIGAKADRLTTRRDQMFLPEYLMINLDHAILNDSIDLAEAPQIVLDFESLNRERKRQSTKYPLLVTSLLFFMALYLNFRKIKLATYFNKVVTILCAILGLFLLFMWFGTDHNATGNNWNLLWLNPLLLLLGILPKMTRNILIYVLLALLGISALNCVITFLPQFFNIAFLPIILTLVLVLYKKLEYRNITMKSSK